MRCSHIRLQSAAELVYIQRVAKSLDQSGDYIPERILQVRR